MNGAGGGVPASRAPRVFDIGSEKPLEVWITKSGLIRMREQGAQVVLETSVGAAYFSAVRSRTLSDLRDRQRRAVRAAREKKGARR